MIVTTFASGLATTGTVAARLGWAGLACLFAGVVPYAVSLRALSRGRLSSLELPDRSERLRPMLWALFSVAIGFGLLLALHAPAQVLAVQVAMVAGGLICTAITSVWKVSLHTGAAASSATAMAALFGWVLLPVTLVLAAGVGWSRIRLRRHTLAQVVAGFAIGVATTAAAFAWLT